MKPFDLQKAMAGDPIVTRDGREVKFIAYVPEANQIQRIVVLIDKSLGFLREDGRNWKDTDTSSDLFMAPKKRTVWVVLYQNGSCAPHHFNDVSSAKAYAHQANSYGFKPVGGKVYSVEIEE